MNLKVPGAILPLGCAILSTRAKTLIGVVATPLRRTRVNAAKTYYMIMGTQYMTSMEDEGVSNVDIILDNTKLQRVDNTKFLVLE